MHTQSLSVAGYHIFLQSELQIGLEPGYIPFLCSDVNRQVDVVITCINNIPPSLLNKKELLFEAGDSKQKYFSIFDESEEYCKIIVFDQIRKDQIQQVALLNKNLKEWIIFMECTSDDTISYPLIYPMGPIIFYYLTVKYDAVMIHASGILDQTKGKVFTGYSGSGKSTIAELWRQAGSIIINDDRLIIRKEKDGYNLHNTPMFYVDIPKMAQLEALYIIEHANENYITRLGGANAVSGMMAFCIQHGYERKYIQHHLTFFNELCSDLPVYQLGFVPDKNIVNFIKSHGV